MNPLGTRARAEELAALLEGGVSSGRSGSAAQVAVAMRLRSIGAELDARATLRPDFRAALRTRLVAVAEVQAANAATPFAEPLPRTNPLDVVTAWTQSRRVQRRMGVTAGAMAGVIALTGVGVAASKSLPGQPFYSVKRGAESVQLSLASGDQAKGTRHLEHAETRLREVSALSSGADQLALIRGSAALAAPRAFGAPLQEKINGTLADFNAETRSGRMLLERVYRKTGKQEPLRILKTFSSAQQTKLSALLPQLPQESKVIAEQALALVEDVDASATEQLALGICGGECFPGNAGPKLPIEPVPSPGATATPTPSTGEDDGEGDNNGVGECTSCSPQPTAEPEPTASPEPEPSEAPSPTPSPSSSPTPAPTSSPTPSPTPSPSASPGILPVPLPGPIATLVPLSPGGPQPSAPLSGTGGVVKPATGRLP